ncbi:MAG: CSLREA domain-containing protein, partial [Acidobacteriota bacterium]
MTSNARSFLTSYIHRVSPLGLDPPRFRHSRRLGASILFAFLTIGGPAFSATITVDSAADNETGGDGLCTLREALNNANADGQTTGGDCTAGSGTDTIEFDIAGGSPIEIELTSVLFVTDAVVIDGTTQPGNTDACTTPIPDRPTYGLSILGDGVTGSGPDTAIRLQADGSTLRGLNFRGFDFTTLILTADDNTIECNFIGSTADGSSVGSTFDSGSWGVSFQSAASDNTVRDNLISGKGVGIRFGGNSTGNQIQRNFIGTDRAGTAAIANDIGVFINGDNELGTAGNGNLISGNTTVGVRISGSSTVVYDNQIGTDSGGTSAVPNGLGIEILGDANVVGSDASGRRNVISGNTGVGVEIAGADNELAANYIGVDITGAAALPNGSHGVTVAGSGTFIKT